MASPPHRVVRASSDAGSRRQHYGVTLAVLALAGVAFALLQSLVAPALPEIRHHLHTSEAANVVAATGLPAEHGFTLAFWLAAAALAMGVVAALAIPGRAAGGRAAVPAPAPQEAWR